MFHVEDHTLTYKSSQCSKVRADASYRKVLQSSQKFERTQNSSHQLSASHLKTPPNSLQSVKNQQSAWTTHVLANDHTSTPLSSFSGGRTTRSGRRSPAKFNFNGSKSERENIPPPESCNLNEINVQYSFNSSSHMSSSLATQKSNILGASALNFFKPSSKRPTEDSSFVLPPKKLKLFEMGIIERNEFEPNSLPGDSWALNVENNPVEFPKKFSSQLNYFSFELNLLTNKTSTSPATLSNGSQPTPSVSDPMNIEQVKHGNNRKERDLCKDEVDDRLTTIGEHLDQVDTDENLCLPLVVGKRHDCRSISANTLLRVIGGEYANQFDDITIIDCRYPYEYLGGHIRGAINVTTKEEMEQTFTECKIQPGRKSLLIFHCEFSSERGPKLMQYLRSIDRQTNLERYPYLYYPELYLLDGGYKAFFETHPSLCEPNGYIPMTHEDHTQELRHFKSKSKSWALGDNRTGFARGSKRRALRSSRSRCQDVDTIMEVDESRHPGANGERQNPVNRPKRKNSRVLFYHSENSCQDNAGNELECLGLKIIE